jgi:threonine dehydrogenase-like Zn-dependent dehydrogenase
MKAVAAVPGTGELHLIEIDPPTITSPTQVLVQVLQVGVCGTDRAIASGEEGEAPLGASRLILGHEMLGRVSQVGPEVRSIKTGGLVVATVRRGCGQCVSCHQGRSDFCYTGRYTERGIKGADGSMTHWIVEEEVNLVTVPKFLEDVGVLIEPLSTVEKGVATALTFQRRLSPPCGHREHAYDSPYWGIHKRALVAGTGPMGMLGAFILRAHGAETYVIARQAPDSAKGRLVEEIGGHYISMAGIGYEEMKTQIGPMDLVLEATGAPRVPFDLLPTLGRNGVMSMVGTPTGTIEMALDGSSMIREMVMNNQAMLGSVNAGLHDFQAAVDDLGLFRELFGGAIDKVITHRYPLEQFREPIQSPPRDVIKAVVET